LERWNAFIYAIRYKGLGGGFIEYTEKLLLKLKTGYHRWFHYTGTGTKDVNSTPTAKVLEKMTNRTGQYWLLSIQGK
jgi:hypothetical protein